MGNLASLRFVLLAAALGGCSHGDDFTVEVQEDAVATVQGKKPRSLKKGGRITSPGDPVLIEAPGKLGLIVLPIDGDTRKVKANLKPFTAFGDSVLQTEANALVSRVLPEVVEVQRLLARRQSEAALTRATELVGRYPGIVYLKLLKVSCLIVNDRSEEARELLDEALAALPNDGLTTELVKVLATKETP